jgi:hypothetical protein
MTEKAPAEFVDGPDGRVFGNLEAEHVAVEAGRCWHIEDLEQGAKALHVDWHGDLREGSLLAVENTPRPAGTAISVA